LEDFHIFGNGSEKVVALGTRVATARGDNAAQPSSQNKTQSDQTSLPSSVPPATAEGLGPIAVATVASLGDNDTPISVVAGPGLRQS
jgi:hypothetical protein